MVAWESRFKSESKRQVVTAILMLLILALSTGGAFWYSASHSKPTPQQPDRSLGKIKLGVFHINVPRAWNRSAYALKDSDIITEVRFKEPQLRPSQTPRMLLIKHRATPQAVHPRFFEQTVLTEIDYESKGIRFTQSNKAVIKFGSMTFFTFSLEFGPAPVGEIVAIGTFDGYQHLSIRLRTRNVQRSDSRALLQKILNSVTDTRYTPMDAADWSAAGLGATLPKGIRSFIRKGAAGDLDEYYLAQDNVGDLILTRFRILSLVSPVIPPTLHPKDNPKQRQLDQFFDKSRQKTLYDRITRFLIRTYIDRSRKIPQFAIFNFGYPDVLLEATGIIIPTRLNRRIVNEIQMIDLNQDNKVLWLDIHASDDLYRRSTRDQQALPRPEWASQEVMQTVLSLLRARNGSSRDTTSTD